MDKQWIHNHNRCDVEYFDGIDKFTEFATRHNPGSTHIRCPCRRCNNSMWETFENVRFHLVRNGMMETYTTWYHHGERLDQTSSSYVTQVETVESNVDPSKQVMNIVNDVYPYASSNTNQEGGDDDRPTMDNEEFKNYEKLLKNAKQELYPGCENFSVLSAIVELMHGKIKFRLSNKCFDYFLGVIKRMLPKENCLPENHKSAQKVLKGLGLGYEKIHPCVNNCILFYKENKQKTKIPQKVMRYLPLKPRLQRLYMSMHTATDMRWHKEGRVNDDVTRHPADGEAWKEFDRMYPDFAADPQNVRLGLATDGFNPFGVLNQNHSTWPVVVFPYNLLPWKCMKKEYMMLTLLMSEDLGKSIDVYMRPLVDELKDLWENGVRTYDKYYGQMFTMRAAMMWTVNDFPAYAMVSGWMTKGYLACPICKENVTSSWHARKVCYLGHRRWLPWDNEWHIEGKTKDMIEARLDLERMGIRSSMWMQRVGGTLKKCHPFFTVKPNGKKELFNFISSVKFPDGYASNISRCVNVKGCKFSNIKSHDCHVILQRLLPIGIRHLLPLNDDIVNVLCKFEQIFPPAFFTSMIHVMIHLPNEVLLARPHTFYLCRYIGELKKFVRNRAKPEGSLVEAWVAYESLTFCAMYLQDVETTFNRPQRNNDSGVRKEKLSFLGATCDDKLSTQNSGVHVPGAGNSEDIVFYGKLTCVVQLLYKDRCQVILFKCLWFDTNPHNRTSVKRDHGLLSVNTTRYWYDEDLYILATMAKQIFYLDDPKADNGWKVVQKIDRRGLYDIPELDHDENDDNVADQQLSSSIEIGEETLRDTNIVQEPFDVPGVPEFKISIDLGDLPQYNAAEMANEDEDEWESGNDSSDDSESYYCSSDED
ncbi:unnamed protein product [Malus baccata var. baccata]